MYILGIKPTTNTRTPKKAPVTKYLNTENNHRIPYSKTH